MTTARGLFRVIVSLFCLVALAVMVELLCRVGYRHLVPADGRAAVELLLGTWKGGERVSPHPYMLYVNTPNYVAEGFTQHNSLGYRSPEFGPCEAPCLRVLAIGGSTTYGHPLPDPDDAWPAQLEGQLHSAGVPAQVINGGLNYATSAELLAHWMFRDRYLRPDVAIVHGPGNDITPLIFDEYDAEYTSFRKGWAGPAFGRRAGERRLLRLASMRVAYGWWLRRSGVQPGFFWQPKAFSELSLDEALGNVRRHEPLGFRRNLDLLLRAILADGTKPVYLEFAPAPKKVYERPLPKTARYLEHLIDATLEAHRKEAKVAEEIANALGVPYLRLPADALSLEFFLDQSHLDRRGEAVKAQFLADFIKREFDLAAPRVTHVQ